MIIRRERRDRFTRIDNDVCEDKRLSFEALGVLAYLLSRPNDWIVRKEELRKRGSTGRDKLDRVLRDLREAGYLEYRPGRSTDGTNQFERGEYIVREVPLQTTPTDANRDMFDRVAIRRPEKPEPGKPGARETHTVLRNNKYQIPPLSPPERVARPFGMEGRSSEPRGNRSRRRRIEPARPQALPAALPVLVPWTPAWWCWMNGCLDRGEGVAAAWARARSNKAGGLTVAPTECPSPEDVAAMRRVESGRAEHAAWRTWLSDRGLTLPDGVELWTADGREPFPSALAMAPPIAAIG